MSTIWKQHILEVLRAFTSLGFIHKVIVCVRVIGIIDIMHRCRQCDAQVLLSILTLVSYRRIVSKLSTHYCAEDLLFYMGWTNGNSFCSYFIIYFHK